MRRALTVSGFAVLAAAAIASADDASATVTAKKEEVAFHVDLQGAFDAKDAVEIAVRPQIWGDELEVEEAGPSGTVEAGAGLVRFRTEKIDDAIRVAERELGIAKAILAVQTEEQRRQFEAAAIAMAKTELDARTAQRALDDFEKVEMPLRLEEADHGIQGTRNYIADQTEELAQLEKMYKADDLTEETEEIVLKR